MANPEHLELLRQGVDVWNAWRDKEPPVEANLSRTYLVGANLSRANLSRTNLVGANLYEANLSRTNLVGAKLYEANLTGAILVGANLAGAQLGGANLSGANLSGADLSGADLSGANLYRANLGKAQLVGANLYRVNLYKANVHAANLDAANLDAANLVGANLIEVNLSGANLAGAALVETNLEDAILINCRIYGISAWGVKLSEGTKQQGLIITPEGEPAITTDDLEIAQFIYLLLHNEKIRRVIDTVGKKGVLLLGRFTEGRIKVMERLRDELRKRDYVPIVFNFDKPETKDFTETVRLLTGWLVEVRHRRHHQPQVIAAGAASDGP
jgi:uncharacterized protein YjbI with pentapeptide repeats